MRSTLRDLRRLVGRVMTPPGRPESGWGQQPPQWGQPPPQWNRQPNQWSQRPPNQWGPQPPRRALPQRWIWIAIGSACALTIVVVAVIALSTRSDSGTTNSQNTAGTITGSSEQWIESVCRTGTFAEGHPLPGAESGALCIPKGGSGAISIGTFDSDFRMRNAIAMLRMRYYASSKSSDGTVWVFAVMAGDASILGPLTQFGFTINPAPSQ